MPESGPPTPHRPGRRAHGQNTTSNSRDNVFSDGTDHEMASVTGDASTGCNATLTIGV